MIKQKGHKCFDEACDINEQLPRHFFVSFEEVGSAQKPQVKVTCNGSSLGDIINDNSYENDFYRYHILSSSLNL